jgi:hypothetical protein
MVRILNVELWIMNYFTAKVLNKIFTFFLLYVLLAHD